MVGSERRAASRRTIVTSLPTTTTETAVSTHLTACRKHLPASFPGTRTPHTTQLKRQPQETSAVRKTSIPRCGEDTCYAGVHNAACSPHRRELDTVCQRACSPPARCPCTCTTPSTCNNDNDDASPHRAKPSHSSRKSMRPAGAQALAAPNSPTSAVSFVMHSRRSLRDPHDANNFPTNPGCAAPEHPGKVLHPMVLAGGEEMHGDATPTREHSQETHARRRHLTLPLHR
jgi:hypothetical protein